MDGEPQIELFATHQMVIEGSTVDLVCSFQDYCPSDITWWMSEDVAGDTQTDSNGTLLNSGHVLRLSALLVRDSSRYCCHSNNTRGGGTCGLMVYNTYSPDLVHTLETPDVCSITQCLMVSYRHSIPNSMCVWCSHSSLYTEGHP